MSSTGSFGRSVGLTLPKAVAISLPIHSLLSWKIDAPHLRVLRLRPPLSGGGSQGVLSATEISHILQQAVALAEELNASSRQLRLVYVHLTAAQCGRLVRRTCECRQTEDAEMLLRLARQLEGARKSMGSASWNAGSGTASSSSAATCFNREVGERDDTRRVAPSAYAVVSRDVDELLTDKRLPFKRRKPGWRRVEANSVSFVSREGGNEDFGFHDGTNLKTRREDGSPETEEEEEEVFFGSREERLWERSLKALPQSASENPLLIEGWRRSSQTLSAVLLLNPP